MRIMSRKAKQHGVNLPDQHMAAFRLEKFMPTIRSTNCTYEELGHTAEIGLRLEADTAANLFTCAAQAMFDLIQPVLSAPLKESVAATEDSEWHQVVLSADDQESLLVDWLSELLYLYETTGLVFHRYHITTWEPTFIEATVTGDKPDQPAAMHIKAITYHQLEVAQTPDNWQARIFFDI